MAAIAVGVVLRTASYLSGRSLWLDPAMLALNLVAKTPLELLGKLDWNQAAPPGFLLLSKLAGSAFDYREVSLKFWPWVASVIALVLLRPLLARIVNPRHSIVALLPFATCSTAIFYAGEFKQYSGDVTATVLVLLAFASVLDRDFSPSALARFVVASIAAGWFSHSSAFVVMGSGIALLVAMASPPNRRHSRSVATALAVVALHGIALYWFQIRPAMPSDLSTLHAQSVSFELPFGETLAAVTRLVIDYFRFPLGFHVTVVPGMVACAMGLLCWSRDRRDRVIQVALTAPLLLLIVAGRAGLYPIYTGGNDVNSRFVLFTVPVLLILSARGVARAARVSPILGGALGLLVTILAIPAIWDRPAVIQQEMRPLVAQLSSAKGDNDVVYVFHASLPAFEFYTRESPIAFVAGASASGLTASLAHEMAALRHQPRVWIVFTHDYEGARDRADRALRTTHRRAESNAWPGASLDLYVLKAPPNTAIPAT